MRSIADFICPQKAIMFIQTFMTKQAITSPIAQAGKKMKKILGWKKSLFTIWEHPIKTMTHTDWF